MSVFSRLEKLQAAMKHGRMHLRLIVARLVEAFDGHLPDRAVHPFDLAVCRETTFSGPFISLIKG